MTTSRQLALRHQARSNVRAAGLVRNGRKEVLSLKEGNKEGNAIVEGRFSIDE